ncbi:hypothetical protein ACWGE0_26455 [Lentzea sp. NPDC054927]
MNKRALLTGVVAASVLAFGVLAPTAASAVTVQDGGWTFTGDTYNDDILGRAKCQSVAVAREEIYFPRDYDCHWAVPLKLGVVGLWYR